MASPSLPSSRLGSSSLCRSFSAPLACQAETADTVDAGSSFFVKNTFVEVSQDDEDDGDPSVCAQCKKKKCRHGSTKCNRGNDKCKYCHCWVPRVGAQKRRPRIGSPKSAVVDVGGNPSIDGREKSSETSAMFEGDQFPSIRGQNANNCFFQPVWFWMAEW
eukprot:TRINITY_DN41863_c0_g1_i1.p1 TRINITY_DN41863_c0_g1~~TRINITY_DN41863_c0_g1_i1.p1  ORF type:complete len:161 (-),score=19.99 TRINITY_DN41863_c0_g1_i1:133-615(-)